MMKMIKVALCAALLAGSYATTTPVQAEPLRIVIDEGVIEPLPIAVPAFVAAGNGGEEYARQINQVIVADLVRSGLFREIPRDAHISGIGNFDAPVQFADWRAINADALVTGAVSVQGDKLELKFRLFDVLSQNSMEGQKFAASKGSWRRMAHKVADAIYARLTGETGYFDSRVVYIAEEGRKNNRKSRLAIMDYDGANNRYLTDDSSIVLAPRFSPNAKEVVYTSYESGVPKVYLMNVDTLERRLLDDTPGVTFAPRFSPDGKKVVFSLTERGNTDLYVMDIASGAKTRLTSGSSIETAPSFSPDGSQIVFESDRGGKQQIYVMPANGGSPNRISFGEGSYGTPVWSPRGDIIAFTNIKGGQFHIGVMRTDGSQENLLTRSFLDEGPTWSPNGRVIMFFRETAGATGAPGLYSVDVTGRFLKKVQTPTFGSDPAWSSLLK